MSKKTRDILYCVLLISFSVTGIIYADVTIDQRVVQYELARPDRYVQVWLGVLCLLAILLLIRTLRRNDISAAPKMIYQPVIVTAALFLLFITSMPYLGYTISSFLFLAILTLYYNSKINKDTIKEKRVVHLLIVVLYALVLSFGTGFLFKKILFIRLPDYF